MAGRLDHLPDRHQKVGVAGGALRAATMRRVRFVRRRRASPTAQGRAQQAPEPADGGQRVGAADGASGCRSSPRPPPGHGAASLQPLNRRMNEFVRHGNFAHLILQPLDRVIARVALTLLQCARGRAKGRAIPTADTPDV
jgi:hypothetical protein